MSFNPNLSAQIALNQIPETNQQHAILSHLISRGSISQLEARNTYRVERLTSRVVELKRRGVGIKSEFRKDESGKKYVRYSLVG